MASLTTPARRLGVALALGGVAVASLTTVGPGADLRAAMIALKPGDTLALLPGTYASGMVSPPPVSLAIGADRKMSVGTPTQPITVRAADPAARPLILGEIKLWGPSYWVLDGLRVQAVDATRDALRQALTTRRTNPDKLPVLRAPDPGASLVVWRRGR